MANTVGKLKGKSAIMIYQKHGRARNFVGLNFWARGYCVSTVGLDEAVVLEYIRTQEERDKEGRPTSIRILRQPMAGPNRPLLRGLPHTTRYAGST